MVTASPTREERAYRRKTAPVESLDADEILQDIVEARALRSPFTILRSRRRGARRELVQAVRVLARGMSIDQGSARRRRLSMPCSSRSPGGRGRSSEPRSGSSRTGPS